MDTTAENFVPKVHPATRAAEPDDPMSLHATPVAGDPEVMIRGVIQEFAGMGWQLPEIIALFRDPFYPLLHGCWLALGEDGIRQRVESVIRRYGVYRFRTSVHEVADDPEPDVVQIGPMGSGEGRHGRGV